MKLNKSKNKFNTFTRSSFSSKVLKTPVALLESLGILSAYIFFFPAFSITQSANDEEHSWFVLFLDAHTGKTKLKIPNKKSKNLGDRGEKAQKRGGCGRKMVTC